MVLCNCTKNESKLTNRYLDMVPDRQNVWTDDAKPISLRLRRGIMFTFASVGRLALPNSENITKESVQLKLRNTLPLTQTFKSDLPKCLMKTLISFSKCLMKTLISFFLFSFFFFFGGGGGGLVRG